MAFFSKNLSKLELIILFIGLLASLCTIIGTIALIIPILQGHILSIWFVAQNLILIFLLVLLVGYFIRVAEIRGTALKEWEENRYEIPHSIHGFIHEMRDFFADEEEHRFRPDRCYAQLMLACNHCKTIFDRLTKIDNTVTIKMVIDEGQKFITIARNQAAAASRGCLQKNPILGNTAFMHIANTGNLASSRFYLNNVLQHDKNYRNTNPNWRNEYTSTVLVPIRKGNVLLGCMAIDSSIKENIKSENNENYSVREIYNERNHVQLLAIFADLIYCILDKSIQFTEELERQLVTEGVDHA